MENIMQRQRVKIPFTPWEVVEEGLQEENNLYFESNFTLGNGYMGVRGLLEEGFPREMETYPGTYLSGVYDNFSGPYVELVNCPDFFHSEVMVGEYPMIPTKENTDEYKRVLNMKDGTLTREFVWTAPDGSRTRIYWQRFLSMDNVHLACQRFQAKPLNHSHTIVLKTGLTSDVFNRRQQDYPPLKEIIPNYHLDFLGAGISPNSGSWMSAQTKTRKTELAFCVHVKSVEGGSFRSYTIENGVMLEFTFAGAPGKCVGMDKVVSIYTSRDGSAPLPQALTDDGTMASTTSVRGDGSYDSLLVGHRVAWEKRWQYADIKIEGDDSAQQGVRFNLFHLIQANARDNDRVSLAAKLLSHTRYQGNAFWDTETFMFPFYLYTDPQAAKNLLLYRYHLLPAAKERAREHFLKGAMFPWCSADDGSEQCQTWEYGDCEIHITADVAYAFDQYVKATGDMDFFYDYAVEIYVETARFWASRVNLDERSGCYVLVAVKGPDEYCAVTNNNMYTNYMAAYNLRLAVKAVKHYEAKEPERWQELAGRLAFDPAEIGQWNEIADGMAQNWDEKNPDLLIQDDTFLMQPEEDLAPFADRKKPVLEILGYEHVMRVQILRQTDVVLLQYLLDEEFTKAQKLAAFLYYEPITTHDSSLSYNTHCIMAAELGMTEKAEDYFYKSCRLDLDDEFDVVRSGLHGAAMGGTYMTVVNGFAGLRLVDGKVSLKPYLPKHWKSLTFFLHIQGRILEVTVTGQGTELHLVEGESLTVLLHEEEVQVTC